MVCSRCGNICSLCCMGKTLIGVEIHMFCKRCGTSVRENAKFCNKCGNPIPVYRNTKSASKETLTVPKKISVKSKSKVVKKGNVFVRVFGRMVGSALGKMLTYLIVYLIAFGLVALSIEISFIAPITALFTIIYGWRFINFLTPAMFVWMPLAGWLIYFTVKLFVAAILGLFIVPYQIARSMINFAADCYDE